MMTSKPCTSSSVTHTETDARLNGVVGKTIDTTMSVTKSLVVDRSFTSVLQGLTLNMEEPWERSLSRLLEDGKSITSIDDGDNSNVNLVSPKSIHHLVQPELMLLGRTESRDYAYQVEGSTCNGFDDNSSIVAMSRSGSPVRRHSSIYRKRLSITSSTTTKKNQKSLFDDSDDEKSVDTNDSGRCRLVYKFSNESSFLFCDVNDRHYHLDHKNQQIEDRGDEEDDSDRKDDDMMTSNRRSFSIRKATAIIDDDENQNNSNYYREWLLYIPDPPNASGSRQQERIQRSISDLYLPTF